MGGLFKSAGPCAWAQRAHGLIRHFLGMCEHSIVTFPLRSPIEYFLFYDWLVSPPFSCWSVLDDCSVTWFGSHYCELHWIMHFQFVHLDWMHFIDLSCLNRIKWLNFSLPLISLHLGGVMDDCSVIWFWFHYYEIHWLNFLNFSLKNLIEFTQLTSFLWTASNGWTFPCFRSST